MGNEQGVQGHAPTQQDRKLPTSVLHCKQFRTWAAWRGGGIEKAGEFEQFLGARVRDDGTFFRLWAPDCDSIEIVEEAAEPGATSGGARHALVRSESGQFHEGFVRGLRAGGRYRVAPGAGAQPVPDPLSRFQPDGVHGASQVVDGAAFEWGPEERAWRGATLDSVAPGGVYEIHVGTFSPEGTFAGAAARLRHVAELGAAAVELMPVNQFPGDRNWGYDGTFWCAPARSYGTPDDLRAFVREAHRLGLSVVLDVVLNHMGPEGDYLPRFAHRYKARGKSIEWGAALDYGSDLRWVATEVVLQWVLEYHFDGLRVDASHCMFDDSRPHALEEITAIVKDAGRRALDKDVLVILEDGRNWPALYAPRSLGGAGCDAGWIDDFCHVLRSMLGDARFGEYRAPQLAECIASGMLHRREPWWGRGPVALLPDARSSVFFVENHDRVGNRAQGDRLQQWAPGGARALRAAAALLLACPQVPLLFQGQEWAASAPFLFFTDHAGDLGRSIGAGRQREHAGQPGWEDLSKIPDPNDPRTFAISKLDWAEAEAGGGPHAATLALHRELLALRRAEPALGAPARALASAGCAGDWVVTLLRRPAGGEAVGPAPVGSVFCAVHLGPPERAGEAAVSVPLPPAAAGAAWRPLLSSEEARFGGSGPEAKGEPGPGAASVQLAPLSALLLALRPADA